jgi:N-acyl homoserine lactone hydrolase
MKLYPLLLGRVKVPYGQFYGGLSGWQGLGALLRYVFDKSHFIEVPIHAYLLDHPREGLVLIDAGICPEQAHHHRQYYRGLLGMTLNDDEYRQAANETLQEQLKPLGHSVNDIRTVILTHLHDDHAGGLRQLPKAKVVIAKTEWEARHMKLLGFIPMFYEPSFGAVAQWQYVSFESSAFHSFDQSEDLFRDGSVRLLPTPGHTPGHTSALIDMGEYRLLVTGDCLYTLRHLAYEQVQAIRFSRRSGDQQIDSIKRISALRKLIPGLHLVVGHDHTDYHSKYLAPFLAKGWLSADERRAMAAYEACLFDANGRLPAPALPRFTPGHARRAPGTVSEPKVGETC